MTAVTLTQRTARFRTARFRPARALRLEIKHSAVVWVLPVLAALFYVNAYRTAAGYPPTWTVRASVITGPNLIFFSVIAAGIAACVATREGRRKTGDLLGDDGPRGLGAAGDGARRHGVLDDARLPGRGRRHLPADRAPGDLGRPAAVAGGGRRRGGGRVLRGSASPVAPCSPAGSPRRSSRSRSSSRGSSESTPRTA